MALDVQRSIARESTLEVLIEDIESNLDAVMNKLLIPFKDRVSQGIECIHGAREKILKSENADVACQVEARKFADLLILVYESSLMLEEAQYLIDEKQDWRKAVMAMIYIDDKMSPSLQKITGKTLPVKYFDSIFYMEKIDSLEPSR